ncbi:SDR family NAD(P)-dependent oxidoreductase [Planctomycetota bacterium]|nr:SDR family NAD(P)-dependent oxidoreductase [Planctomycetota bacterium]
MKQLFVIGASGLIGSKIVELAQNQYQIITASRSAGQHQLDIADPKSVDAVVCTAGMATFKTIADSTDNDWTFSIHNKLLGQINTIRYALPKVNPHGAIVLTTGILTQNPIVGSSQFTAVNAAVEGMIAACKVELDTNIRIGVISPGWITETLIAMNLDPKQGQPAIDVARAYLQYIESGTHGQIVTTYN